MGNHLHLNWYMEQSSKSPDQFSVGIKREFSPLLGVGELQSDGEYDYMLVGGICDRADAIAMAFAPKLLAALRAVIDATSDYLPPDGIDAKECVSRVLAATDTPEIYHFLRSLEGGAS